MLELETTIGKIIYSEAPITTEPTKDYKYNFLSQMINSQYFQITDYNASVSSKIILGKTLKINNEQFQFTTLSLYGLLDSQINIDKFVLSVTLNSNNNYILHIESLDKNYTDNTSLESLSHFYFIPNGALQKIEVHTKGTMSRLKNKSRSNTSQEYNESLLITLNKFGATNELVGLVNETLQELDEDGYYKFYIKRKTFLLNEVLGYIGIKATYKDLQIYGVANREYINHVIKYMHNQKITTGYFVYGRIDCDEYGDYYIGIKPNI